MSVTQKPRTAMRDDDLTFSGPADGSAGQARLAWRWPGSGTSGYGPWTHRRDVVEAWADSLNRRHAGRVEHWVEIAHSDAA